MVPPRAHCCSLVTTPGCLDADLPSLGPAVVLLLPFGPPICSCQHFKVFLSCFRVSRGPCVAASSLPWQSSHQKRLFLLLELLIFSVPVFLSRCIFGCLPLLPLAVSLSVSCVFSVLLFQHCFMMPQSLGVIGGKPNSAHYFIGYVGECPEYRTDFPSISPQLKSRLWSGAALLLALCRMLQGSRWKRKRLLGTEYLCE